MWVTQVKDKNKEDIDPWMSGIVVNVENEGKKNIIKEWVNYI